MDETRSAPGPAAPARLRERLRSRLRRERAAYTGGTERPLGGYLASMTGYGAYAAALSALGRCTGRRAPDRVEPWDLALVTVATFHLSRLLAKGPVTSPLRAPFTRYQGVRAPAELAEEVRGTGPRKALGELVTCPFCLGTWVATTLVAGLALCPRATRLAAASLTAMAGSDALQFGYASLAGANDPPEDHEDGGDRPGAAPERREDA
ncbi:DUF1360 domain-containing protein [Streptomyces capparidis]